MFEQFLTGSAFVLGTGHTLMGPDHYLPLASVAAVRRWTLARTLYLTALCCGVHLCLSVALVALGLRLHSEWTLLAQMEDLRGAAVGWFLLLCGVLCLAWVYRPAQLRRHGNPAPGGRIMFWMVFCALLLGPCEVLLPLALPPAIAGDAALAWQLVLIFGTATLLSMLVAVSLLSRLCRSVSASERLRRARPFAHALPGVVFMLCGCLVLLGGG